MPALFRTIFSLLLSLILSGVLGQSFNLAGVIKVSSSGEGVPFATVNLKGTAQGTVSNADGYFSLLHLRSDSLVLQVKCLGYLSKEIMVTKESSSGLLRIELDENITELQAVEVRGEPDEVIDLSQPQTISQVSLSPRKLSALPNFGERDIFKALQLLPGISGTNESSAGLYVRGGTPDQNLVLLDGFTVYYVDHFYGFFSAFNADAIKNVQLYKGGFDARFGGRTSSVMELTGKTGNSKQVSGTAGVSFISLHASLEVPIGKKGNFLFAARRSYTDLIESDLYKKIFNLFKNNTPISSGSPITGINLQQNQTEPSFYFYDLNSKFSYKPSNRDILSWSVYNGQDNLDNSRLSINPIKTPSSTTFLVFDIKDYQKWGNWGSSARWGRQWNSSVYTTLIAAYSNYFSSRDRANQISLQLSDTTLSRTIRLREDNDLKDYTVREDTEIKLSSHHTLQIGGQLTQLNIKYNYTLTDTLRLVDQNKTGTTAAVYLQDEWLPFAKLSIKGGMRTTYYDVTRQYYFEPRANFILSLTEKIKLKGAVGRYYQFANRIVREDISQGSRDFWLLADDKDSPVSSADHFIGGLSYETNGWLFSTEYFEKHMDGLAEFSLRFRSTNPLTATNNSYFFRGTGVARGIEWLAQKKSGAFTGWMGYTYSEVVHTFPGISQTPFYALQDQRHEVKIVTAYQPKNWEFSLVWIYGSGKPYTAPYGQYEIKTLDGTNNQFISVGDKNAFRFQSYQRLDASVTYHFKMTKGTGDIGLSLFNIYNHLNTWYKEFEVSNNQVIETNVNYIGFTPSLFFNVRI